VTLVTIASLPGRDARIGPPSTRCREVYMALPSHSGRWRIMAVAISAATTVFQLGHTRFSICEKSQYYFDLP